MNQFTHVEIPIDDPDRAAAFYRAVFGWRARPWGPIDYWPLTTDSDPARSVGGALSPRADTPEGVLVYVDVDDVDDAVARVEQAGGTVVRASQPVPGVGWSALVRDSEGNLIGLFHGDPTAGGRD